MDKMKAFQSLWAAEGNAQRAATLLGYAFVVQCAGWDALDLNANKKRGAQDAFHRANLDPAQICFRPVGETFEGFRAEQIQAERRELEREFGTLAVNMRGHQYKKTTWRNRHQVTDEDEVFELDYED